MSAVYNRRRGAKANRARKPRECALATGCGLADGASRYCGDHRFRGPSIPENDAARQLRLAHQANQSAEAARLTGKTHVRMAPWMKIVQKKLKAVAATQTFLQALLGVKTVEKVKRLNPWAS